MRQLLFLHLVFVCLFPFQPEIVDRCERWHTADLLILGLSKVGGVLGVLLWLLLLLLLKVGLDGV